MTTLQVFRGICAFAVYVMSVGVAAAPPQPSSDPFVGTWVLNVAKSRYSPGPAPKEQTVVYETAGNGVKVTSKNTDTGGNTVTTVYAAGYDGNDYKVTGNPDWDEISIKRVNANTTEFTRKRAKKVVQTGTNVVSADGKTRTLTANGTDSLGRRVNNVTVYERK
jgi:hypothetical protein